MEGFGGLRGSATPRADTDATDRRKVKPKAHLGLIKLKRGHRISVRTLSGIERGGGRTHIG